jgi:opacity protein-like surface antigen
MLSVFTLLASSFGVGQDSTSRVQVFGGYSLLHTDNSGLNGPALDSFFGTPTGTFGVASNFSGWDTQIQFNANRTLGIVADLGGNYGNLFTASSSSGITGLPAAHSYSFLFGPVVSAHTGKATPFVHALLGVNRLSSSSATSVMGLPFTSLPAVSDSAFAMALGGGVDYNLGSHFGVRLGQLDYLYTGHDMNAVANNIFGAGSFTGLATHQNNLRFATGITLRF